MKKALITGITGQDGSYLAEFLLSKGYEVHGMIRRASTFNTGRIDHIYIDPHKEGAKLFLHYGDLSNSEQISNIIYNTRPDEVYHLGAQSHVRVSFDVPEYTGDITGLGTIRILEAIRRSGHNIKFYQASSSEMFGASPPPQNEETQFYPRSPYGAAKVYSYWIAKNYREGYNLFASNGILFNHECVTADTPVIIRNKNGLINISPIEEIVTHREDFTKGKKYTTVLTEDRQFEVWDGTDWTKVKTLSATWNDAADDKGVYTIISRGSVYSATKNHISFLDGEKEIKTGDIVEGAYIEMKDLPNLSKDMVITDQEAEFIGMMVADGYISPEGKGRLVNNDGNLRKKIASLWLKIAGGSSRESAHPSGYTEDMVGSVELFGNRDYLHLLRKEIYTEKGFKKIPVKILNSDDSQILAFLQGYNACDGLKAGNQKTEFKSFTSNSSVLAAGLFYLIHKALNLRVTLHPEFRGDKVYYHLNINSDCKHGNKGEHLKKPLGQVKGVRKTDYVGWLFDLETESGTFSAGIGLSWIHNSPRRGETFVTRKITRAIASILSKKQDKLFLGNLEAKRDWSFAPECVEAMWLILNHDKAGDFVLGSGESHSVKEFVEKAFFYVGLDWKDYVKVDSKYYRPTEVENLIADASNAKKLLNWKPKIDFDDLIKIMIDADMESAGLKPIGEGLNVIERKFGKNKWWKGN